MRIKDIYQLLSVLTACSLALTLSACATTKSKDVQTARYGVEVEDVEALNDQLLDYKEQKVTVPGEVQDKRAYSFILESGGLINDEILVIPSRQVDMTQFAEFSEDNNVTVIGRVRTATVIEIEEELGWDLDPEIEAEIEGVAGYIVADRVIPQPD